MSEIKIKPIGMYEVGDSELVKYNLFTALEEIERLNNLINKATDRVYELLDEYDMEIWEDISYIPLADYWQKMIKEINKKYYTNDLKDDLLEKDMLKQYLFSEKDDYEVGVDKE